MRYADDLIMRQSGTSDLDRAKRIINKHQVVIQQLEDVIRALHRNCDPVDMTYEDHLVWEEWNKKFHPENYG